MELNKITEIIIGCAIEVHKRLRPGLLESTYEACLFYEIQKVGLKIIRQLGLPWYIKKSGLKKDIGLTFWLKIV